MILAMKTENHHTNTQASDILRNKHRQMIADPRNAEVVVGLSSVGVAISLRRNLISYRLSSLTPSRISMTEHLVYLHIETFRDWHPNRDQSAGQQ